jgi:hypothetical protein
MSSATRNRSLALFALLILLASAERSTAQEVYRASWLIQDRGRLQQEIARSIIARANDWLTRDNPNAPTARLDDPLRVTVVVEFVPATGGLNSRLARLALGPIVIEQGFDTFLDSATIVSLIRRDQFWRDETVTVANQALAPFATPAEDPSLDPLIGSAARAFAAAEAMPRTRIAFDESSLRITPRMHVWAGIGFEEMALPGFIYGRLRAGLSYDAFKVWGEIPAAAGSRENALFAHGLDGSFGAGLSFDLESFGGAVTWSDPLEQSAGEPGEAGYLLGRTALFYGKIPITDAAIFGGYLRLKLGGGYLQTVAKSARENDRDAPRMTDHFLPMARVEYAADPETAGLMHSGAIEILGDNLVASYMQQLSGAFGVRLTASAHGLLSPLEPYLPSYSLIISPVISLW